jgi:16S rRNA (guanine1516-N2)-methyltransferase
LSYELAATAQGLILRCQLPTTSQNYQIDFSKGALRHRFEHLHGTNELITKAIGWKKDLALTVVDATAGLGREAFLMAALGCNVILFERHPTISTLLKDALLRAQSDPHLGEVIARMQLVEGCAIEYLTQKIPQPPDIIYCDPMFEPRIKSAAVKKEMQILQTVVGTDNDAHQLVKVALQTAKKRVVVKRPHIALPLHPNPSYSLKGRSHRFDVYLLSV